MSGPSTSAGLSHFMAGIYPLCSFLHVPGKMSRPAWLSLGTAFLVEPPTPQFDERTKGIALLTAAHTLLPWAYMDDKALKELKLPPEFRKSRYVIGRVYLPDANGDAQRGAWYPVKLSALHPTLDVGLLSMGSHDDAPAEPISAANSNNNTAANAPAAPKKKPKAKPLALSAASLVEADRFRNALAQRHLLRRFKLSSRNLSFDRNNGNATKAGPTSSPCSIADMEQAFAAKAASVASVVGFRAKGLLGTIDTLNPKAFDALEPSVKAKLMAEMNDIEGRQEAATLGMAAMDGGQRRFIMSSSSNNTTTTNKVSRPVDESAPVNGSDSIMTSSSLHDGSNPLRCASIGRVTQGYGFHGMSGSPVVVGKWGDATEVVVPTSSSEGSRSEAPLPPAGWCCGVIHGASSDPSSLVGTTPELAAGAMTTPLKLPPKASSSPNDASTNTNSQTSAAAVVANTSTTAPSTYKANTTNYVSYIPSDAVLEWCVRDLSGINDEATIQSVLLDHDPLKELVLMQRGLEKQTAANKKTDGGCTASTTSTAKPATKTPSSASSSSFVDPVTEDMLKIDDEDAAWIAQMRKEKEERMAKKQRGGGRL